MMRDMPALSLEMAARKALEDLSSQYLTEVRIQRGGAVVTSYSVRQALMKAIESLGISPKDARFSFLDQIEVELKGQDAETVTFCIYRH